MLGFQFINCTPNKIRRKMNVTELRVDQTWLWDNAIMFWAKLMPKSRNWCTMPVNAMTTPPSECL